MALSDYIAISAVIISFVSMGFAIYSSRQAKRQADAVLGDVPPSFGIYQNQIEPYELQAKLSLEIVNHNRKALLLHSLRLEKPDDVILFPSVDDDRDQLRAIIKSVLDNNHHIFQVPHRLRGSSLHSSSVPTLILPFICSWKDSGLSQNKQAKIYFSIEHSHEGDTKTRCSYGCVLVQPCIPPND